MQSCTEADPIRLAREVPSGVDPVIQIPPPEQTGGLLRHWTSAGQSVPEWR
ncbi:MAG TPA: hypothetical protein VF850_06400 [Gemmatimonadaceae bacterium]